MAAERLRATYRAVRAARAQLGDGSATTRMNNSVRVRLTVEPKLVDDIADLVRRVEGRAERGNESVVTVPFPPGRDPARAVTELRRVLDRWADRHPGVRVEVLRNGDRDHDFASAAGAAAGRGMLAVAAIARRLGNGRSAKRPGVIKRTAFRLRPRPSSDDRLP